MMNQTQISGSKRAQFPIGAPVPMQVVGGTKFGKYKKISSEETFNMYQSDDCLVPFAGHQQVTTISKNGVFRELYASERYNHIIAVVDNGVFTIDSNFGVSKVGTLNTSEGFVSIAENEADQIAISDGLNIYIFTYSNPSSFTIPSIDFLPGYIAFQDTYFIAADSRKNQWRLSANNDGNSWAPAPSNVGAIQTKTTNAVACVPLNRQLFIFGTNVAEPWYDNPYQSPSQLFPYTRNPVFNIDYGTPSVATIAAKFGYLVFLGKNESGGLSIKFSKGGEVQKISNDGLDALFARLTAPQDSFGFLCEIDGHVFYILTFTTDNLTYCYDFNTEMFLTLTDENLNHHIAKRVTYFNGKYYFGSFVDGNLYELSTSYTTYNGKSIPRSRILPPIRFPNCDNFIVSNVNLTVEQGMTPYMQKAEISLSRDGGESYGNVQQLQFNNFGQRPNIFQCWKLGMANDLRIKLTFWSKGRFVLCGGTMVVRA